MRELKEKGENNPWRHLQYGEQLFILTFQKQFTRPCEPLDLHQCTKYPGKKLPETLETCHFANGLISLISSLWLHLLRPPCGKRRYMDINRKYNSSLHVRHRFIYRFNSMAWKGYRPHNCLMLRCVSAYCGFIWTRLDVMVMVGFECEAGTLFCPIDVDVYII